VARSGKEKMSRSKIYFTLRTLGTYDFMDIYEAPNAETAAKVSMISLSNGAFHAESWTAIPYKEFLKLTKKI